LNRLDDAICRTDLPWELEKSETHEESADEGSTN